MPVCIRQRFVVFGQGNPQTFSNRPGISRQGVDRGIQLLPVFEPAQGGLVDFGASRHQPKRVQGVRVRGAAT